MPSTRPNTSPRILAITTLRNEGVFLIDWLAHHRRIGVTDFLVYSNDCDDGTAEMLDRLQALGWLTHQPNPAPHPKGAQWSALNRAAKHPALAGADWIITLDIDEFIHVHTGDGSLTALLQALPGASAITLTWRLFGNAGVRARDGRAVPQIFTHAAPAVMGWPWRAALYKTLYRNDGAFRKPGVHRPRSPDPAHQAGQSWFDGSGRPLPQTFARDRMFSTYGQDNYKLVQLNHYPLGSVEDFVLKCDRGRSNSSAEPLDMAYWVERNLCAVRDEGLAESFAICNDLRAELRADATLAALEARAANWRAARLATLLQEESYRALYGRLLMAPASRLLSAEESRFLFSHAIGRQPPGD